MVIMVGSFTLQLPTSASVATLLAFAKPWLYCMFGFGGNFFTFGGFDERDISWRTMGLTKYVSKNIGILDN